MTVYVKPIFIRPNGTALAGGFVKVLESGSNSTLKTTYSNSAMTVPNTNPIVLDGSGRADIWFTGPADYEVFDSNMVLQYRQNGVYGLGSASINIDSVDRTKRNLRGEDDINETLGTATERCGRFIRFDCDGEPELLTLAQLAALLNVYNISFADLGWFCCDPINYLDCGTFAEDPELYIDLGIFIPLVCC
jgi:hypothetical protein